MVNVTTPAISNESFRKYQIISAMAANADGASLAEIELVTGIPGVTIKRQIRAIKNDFGMDIEFVRNETKGNSGKYVITQWGIITPAGFGLFMRKLLQQKKGN